MIIRIILIPIYMVVTVLRIGLSLVVKLSDWIFYLLGILFLLVTVCCYYMQIESGEGLKQMIIGSGIMFLIPQVASLLTGALEVAGEVIGDRIRVNR